MVQDPSGVCVYKVERKMKSNRYCNYNQPQENRTKKKNTWSIVGQLTNRLPISNIDIKYWITTEYKTESLLITTKKKKKI